MRPRPGEVLHFSEDPTISRFEPHVAATAVRSEPYVWGSGLRPVPGLLVSSRLSACHGMGHGNIHPRRPRPDPAAWRRRPCPRHRVRMAGSDAHN
ncbi:MAG: DUF6886 family protein [Pseudonocardia sp.]